MNMAPAAEAIWGTASTASPKGPLPNQHGCGTTGSLKKMHMQNGDSHNSGVQCAPTARRDHTSHFICLRNPSSHLLLLAAPRPLPGTVTCAQPRSPAPTCLWGLQLLQQPPVLHHPSSLQVLAPTSSTRIPSEPVVLSAQAMGPTAGAAVTRSSKPLSNTCTPLQPQHL